MVIAGVMILDAVRELVLGMRHVVHLLMAVLIGDDYFVSRSFHRTVKVREAVSLPCQPTLDRHEGRHNQQRDKLPTNRHHSHGLPRKRALGTPSGSLGLYRSGSVFL